MKATEFRKLIREEVRKVLKEANAPALSFDEITNIIRQHYFASTDQRRRKEYEKILLNIGFLKLKNGMYTVNRDASNSYRTTDNKTMRDILKWYDSIAISSHQKFGTANKKPSNQTPRMDATNTQSPKPDSTIDDWELVNKKIIKPKHEEDWLVLFSDEIELNPKSSASRKKYINMANTWLKDNGYTWRVADALSQNEEGEITWKIA